jgi:hypothetical protein
MVPQRLHEALIGHAVGMGAVGIAFAPLIRVAPSLWLARRMTN